MNNPWDDPFMREMIRRMRELQNNPAYQAAKREIEMRQNDPAYQYMLKEIERREKDPAYRALLESMENRRRNDYSEILRTLPDISQMRDLLKATQSESAALRIQELQDFNSRFKRQDIEFLLNADRLRDSETTLRTLEEIRRAQDIYDRYLSAENVLRQESIRFNPQVEPPAIEKVKPVENEQISAELFLLDLQAKYEELEEELAENEQLVVYAAFNGVTMQVRVALADTYNRIRLVGVIGGIETVAVIKESEFTLFFRKEPVESQKTKRRIGFIIEEETAEGDGEE